MLCGQPFFQQVFVRAFKIWAEFSGRDAARHEQHINAFAHRALHVGADAVADGKDGVVALAGQGRQAAAGEVVDGGCGLPKYSASPPIAS